MADSATTPREIEVIRVSGSPRAAGRQIGAATAESVAQRAERIDVRGAADGLDRLREDVVGQRVVGDRPADCDVERAVARRAPRSQAGGGRVQAHALGLFFDQMINTFDPDALIVGGGALEASEEFQRWFLAEIAAGMPVQRQEQADIPIRVMPNGDTAGARGAALEALRLARQAAATR